MYFQLDSSDLPIFTELGYGVFVQTDSNRLQLINPPVSWIKEFFDDRWDATARTLEFEPFSLIGAHIASCQDRFEKGEPVSTERITFEEEYTDDRWFRGQLVAYAESDVLLYIIRKADDLDSISHREIQVLRKSALERSNFKSALENHEQCRVGINLSELGVNSLARSVIDTAVHPICVFDENHSLVLANGLAVDQFPTLVRAKSPASIETLIEDTNSVATARKLISKVKSGIGSKLSAEWEVAIPLSKILELEVTPIFGENQCFQGTIWSFTNKQSQQKEVAGVVSEADRMEVVGRLAGGVAHDFNNLLAIVLGNISVLINDEEVIGNAAIQKPLAMADQAASKAAILVKQLLGYSRKTRLERSKVDVNEILSKVAELFESSISKEDEFSISIDIPTDSWFVDGDEQKLFQVFLNLLENAYHARSDRGKLKISTRNYLLNDENLADAFECEQGHYVILTVSDNGSGMDTDTRKKIFEPFFTTKEPGKGTGLGLANALGIIQQHGGHISCTSVEGQGTTFSLYLPRFKETQQQVNRNFITAKSDGSSRAGMLSVLVVDDEELLRNLVRTLCEKNGYQTYGAVDGQDALEFILKDEHQIDAIVLDLAMPNMTGTQLFTEMNRRGIDIPVIVASGFLVDTEEFVEETGGRPQAIFSKPYQLSELIDKIDEISGKSVALSS